MVLRGVSARTFWNCASCSSVIPAGVNSLNPSTPPDTAFSSNKNFIVRSLIIAGKDREIHLSYWPATSLFILTPWRMKSSKEFIVISVPREILSTVPDVESALVLKYLSMSANCSRACASFVNFLLNDLTALFSAATTPPMSFLAAYKILYAGLKSL